MTDLSKIDIKVSFRNQQQQDFYFATDRNQLFSGGYNNGKSYIGCLKILTLLCTFSKYRAVIARQTRTDLMKTTYQTFFKLCPREIVEADNKQDGFTILKNASRIDWLHLDKVEDSTLRGLEINSTLTDQSEEVEEKTYDVLDARIGRWDEVIIPESLLTPDWPINPYTGRYLAPSYNLNLSNPDTQFHHLYRFYHPDSLSRLPNHYYVEAEWDPTLGSIETYNKALQHGEEWVERFVRGKWGVSKAQIHRVYPENIIEWCPELEELIKSKGKLFRVLDHGEASPTCCLWVAAVAGVYIFYREYYAPGKVISYHREAIAELSKGETYSGNYADPAIFKKTSQKDGGFWTTADEYLTKEISGPPIAWQAADNNEFATRNRINELLPPQLHFKHPLGLPGKAPGIYFVKRTDSYRNGCSNAIQELGSQRRELVGYIDGESVYNDNREESVKDHAYDCIRYFVAMHGTDPRSVKPKINRNTMAYYNALKQRAKNNGLVPASAR